MQESSISRNYDNIQFADIRATIEQPFNNLHDELTNCYYKYWKNGLSKPFKGYDVQATLEASKALFEELHGLIFHELSVAFHEYNKQLPKDKQIPEAAYDTSPVVERIETKEENGKVVTTIVTAGYESKVEHAKEKIASSKARGISLNLTKVG